MRSIHGGGEGSAEPWSQLRAGLAALTDEDMSAWSDEQLREFLLVAVPDLNSLSALASVAAAHFDARGLAPSDGFKTGRAWLAAFTRMTPGAAKAMLDRGQLLRELPALSAAARAGAVSAEHLRRVDDLATHVGLADVKPFDPILADLASHTTPAETGAACDRIQAHLDPDGPEPDPTAGQRRTLTLSRSGSLINIRGKLDLDGGATLMAALDAAMRPPTPDDDSTPGQRRADALVELGTRALQRGELGTVGGVRPTLGILITVDALTASPGPANPDPDPDPAQHDPLTRAGVPVGTQPPWANWVGTLPTATAQRIACDSIIWRTVLDARTGLPLDVGRTHRLVPTWIRRALHARDRGCRWPRCTVPAEWTDAHHLTPWWLGGETSVDELILLCRYHHSLAHDYGWTITLDRGTGQLHLRRPDGTPYELGPSQPWLGPTHQRPTDHQRPRTQQSTGTDPPLTTAA